MSGEMGRISRGKSTRHFEKYGRTIFFFFFFFSKEKQNYVCNRYRDKVSPPSKQRKGEGERREMKQPRLT